MKIKKISRFLLVVCALAAMPWALSGCAPVDEDQITVADDNPPPVQEVTETIPVIQDPQSEIWIPGYWALNADHYTFSWVPGKLITRPSPTAGWDKARWVHHTYGWTFQEGHWE